MQSYTATIDDVASAVVDMYESFGTSADEEDIVESMRRWFTSDSVTLTSAADECLDRFVEEELDYVTADERGPGRATAFYPRFGARHRNVVSAISEPERIQLGGSIKRHLLCGYVFADFVNDFDRHEELRLDPEILYQAMWMQCMYSPPFPVHQASKWFQDLRTVWFAATAQRLETVFQAQGGTWEQKDIDIITQYFNGGIILRMLEANPRLMEGS